MVVEPPAAAGTDAADEDEPLDDPQPASATASRPAAATPVSHPENREAIFMSGVRAPGGGGLWPPPRPTYVYRFRSDGQVATVAFKQLILREVSRQEGDPHWVNVRSTRSRQVRSLEASAVGETEGRSGSESQRRHSPPRLPWG
jgi:hypothetical protein